MDLDVVHAQAQQLVECGMSRDNRHVVVIAEVEAVRARQQGVLRAAPFGLMGITEIDAEAGEVGGVHLFGPFAAQVEEAHAVEAEQAFLRGYRQRIHLRPVDVNFDDAR